MTTTNKRFVIIGGSGKLAYHLSKSLVIDRRHEIILLDKKKPDADLLENTNIKYIKFDVINDDVSKIKDVILQSDYIFFKVALLGIPSKSCDFQQLNEYIEVNALSLLRFAPLIERSQVKRVIVDSSITAVSQYSIRTPIQETTRTSYPTNFYGLSKAILENLCLYEETLKRVRPLIIRYPRVYIPGQHNFITNFIEQIKENNVIKLSGNPNKLVDLIHVEDATNVVLSILCYEGSMQRFHAAYGNCLSLSQITKMLAKFTNKDELKITRDNSYAAPLEPDEAMLDNKLTVRELKPVLKYTCHTLIWQMLSDHKKLIDN